jgi:hypothetical protein
MLTLVVSTQYIIGGFFLDALRHMYMLYDATSVYGGASNTQVPVRIAVLLFLRTARAPNDTLVC